MDTLEDEHEIFRGNGNLSKSLEDLQKTINLLAQARAAIATDPNSASITLAKLQTPVKQSFESLKTDLREVYAELGNYSKALEKRFKDKSLPLSDHNAPPLRPSLINRAIGMHFLREGQFSVASMFLTETSSKLPEEAPILPGRDHGSTLRSDTAVDVLRSEGLRKQFAEMYHILDEMRSKRNLLPATKWAKVNSSSLQARGSNLEFELVRLQFIWLFTGGSTEIDASRMLECQQAALEYARKEFGDFQGRYLREIQQLIGAVVFCSNLRHSPYKRIFHHSGAWEDLALSFTREFCSFLGLSADSPLYVASTAGAIALPTLQKLQKIKELKRTEWTTQQELPVEVPLPASYHFHSIFVCPVSKEQTTDHNPPMMMPCGHVIAQESLQRLSKGSKFKCPYCPNESHYREAKKIIL